LPLSLGRGGRACRQEKKEEEEEMKKEEGKRGA